MTTQPMKPHEYANIFPMMTDAEYAELKSDIAAHGQIEPIYLFENKILDGRNRYRACMELGIPPQCETFQPNGISALDFVISKNLKRRHLTGGQLAMLAVELEPYFAKSAKERQRDSIKQRDEKGRAKPVSQKVEQLDNGKASEQAARAVGTNRQYVSDAKRIAAHSPELVEPVKRGEMPLKEAAKVARKAQKQNELAIKAESFTLKADDAAPRETRVKIYNRDARQLAKFVSPDVDLVFTSPPYNVGMAYRTHNDRMQTYQYIELLRDVFNQCHAVMRAGARIGVNIPFGVERDPYRPMTPDIFYLLVQCGFTLIGQTIWDKGQQAIGSSTAWGSYASPSAPRFRDRCEAIVWAYKELPALEIPKGAKLLIDGDTFRTLAQDYWHVPPASSPDHPAVFPSALAENALRFFGYEGCHVLDPFSGTGSVGEAAQALHCRASLVEIDAAYCAIAQERIEVE